MAQETLKDLFLDTVKDAYNAEAQLIKALPKMAKAASNAELKAGFEEHLKQTEEHHNRLEKVFEALGEKPRGKTCQAMKGLVEEASEWISEKPEPAVLDAGLIAHAQKVEHYEIATYGCLVTWAQQLDLDDDAVSALKETLAEEKETDEKLTHVAESMVNAEAAAGR